MHPTAWQTAKINLTGTSNLLTETTKEDGIGSGISIKGIGTFKFKLEDDNGQVHTIQVPRSLYVPSLKRVLLAPHHWAHEAQDNVPTPRGMWMATYDNCIILYWNQGKSKCTILLSTNTKTVQWLEKPLPTHRTVSPGL